MKLLKSEISSGPCDGVGPADDDGLVAGTLHERFECLVRGLELLDRVDAGSVDLVFADWSWMTERAGDVDFVVLTHGHEDHIGALGYLMEEIDAPIYATQLTRGLAEVKLRRHHLLDRVVFETIREVRSRNSDSVDFFVTL